MFYFIKREKIYILMLAFILSINLISLIHSNRDQEKRVTGTIYKSDMTFKEIGITEERIKDFFKSGTLTARFYAFFAMLIVLLVVSSFIFDAIYIFKKSPTFLDMNRQRLDKTVPWGISDILRVSLIIIFVGYIINIGMGLLLKIFSIALDLNLRSILGTFFIDLTACCVIFYFVVVKYKERLTSVGMNFAYLVRNIFSGITAYIFIIPILILALLVSIRLLDIIGYNPPPQPVFEVFISEKRSGVLLFLGIFVSVFGPIVEEMFFRGFMYSAIKKRIGVTAAALLSAAIFSSLHTNVVGFFPIMILGFLLAYLYETTGSLISSIAVHILHNTIMVGLVFFIKELMSG